MEVVGLGEGVVVTGVDEDTVAGATIDVDGDGDPCDTTGVVVVVCGAVATCGAGAAAGRGVETGSDARHWVIEPLEAWLFCVVFASFAVVALFVLVVADSPRLPGATILLVGLVFGLAIWK